MAEDLAGRPGGDGLPPVEPAAEEERVDQRAGHPDQIARRAPGAVGVVVKAFRDRTILAAAALASGRSDAAAPGGDPGIVPFGGAGD